MKWKFWKKDEPEEPSEPKRKKFITRILIILTDEDSRKKEQRHEIKMKDGWTWKIEEYHRNLNVYDEERDLVHRFDWQAGYSVHYQIDYDYKEWYESET